MNFVKSIGRLDIWAQILLGTVATCNKT